MQKLLHMNWRNVMAFLTGFACTLLIFFFSFVLPAFLEYKTGPETGLNDMYATYMIYTVISAALFVVAWLKNLWFSQKSTFVRDVGAIAIGLNSMLWGFMFIMSLPN